MNLASAPCMQVTIFCYKSRGDFLCASHSASGVLCWLTALRPRKIPIVRANRSTMKDATTSAASVIAVNRRWPLPRLSCVLRSTKTGQLSSSQKTTKSCKSIYKPPKRLRAICCRLGRTELLGAVMMPFKFQKNSGLPASTGSVHSSTTTSSSQSSGRSQCFEAP